MRLGRAQMTIAQGLSDPPLGRFVQRIEAEDIGQIADAARDLALCAEVVLQHVVLNVAAFDLEAGSEIAAGEEQCPHEAVGGAARVLRPAHGRVAVFLTAAALIVL
jgi:hypothetical protein